MAKGANLRRNIMTYYFSKTITMPFDDAISKLTEELKKEGFGILTDIDVKSTLKKKLDVEFNKYRKAYYNLRRI